MKVRRKAGFWLNSLDENLFRYLHQMKVATIEQINRDIYSSAKINTLHRRLRLLQNLGFIRYCHHHTLGKKKIVSITERGFKNFVSDGTERTVELASQAILHDLKLVDIKYHLLKSDRISRFYSENELKTWDTYWRSDEFSKFIDIHCDGAITANLNGGSVTLAIEFEALQKSDDRSQEIIAKYYRNTMVPAVLFVCGNGSIHRLFVDLETKYLGEQEGRRTGKFLYILLDDLLEQQSLTFTDALGNRLCLGGSLEKNGQNHLSDDCPVQERSIS